MKDQEINAAVAEACGWVAVRRYQKSQTESVYVGYGPANPFPHDKGEEQISDYCNDLNAINSAVKSLGRLPGFRDVDEVRDCYSRHLGNVAWRGESFRQEFKVIEATARQRAEAFLRTVGRWKE